MTDIIASPAVKEAVKVVMEQQERLGDEAAAEARESQPIRTSVLRAAQLAAEAEDHARGRQHVKGKLTARERLDLLLDTGSFEEIGRFAAATSTVAARAPPSSPASARCSAAKWPSTRRTSPSKAARLAWPKAARSAI